MLFAKNVLTERAIQIMLVVGVVSIGQILVTGFVHGAIGVVRGVVLSSSPYEAKRKVTGSIFDTGFNHLEDVGVYILSKSVAGVREGFWSALEGMKLQSNLFVYPFCKFFSKTSSLPEMTKTPDDEEQSSQTETGDDWYSIYAKF